MILAVVALLAFQGPFQNPYCGTTPLGFYPVPDVAPCGTGQHHDTACLRTCIALWSTEMQLAYEQACLDWDAAMATWDLQQDIVDAALDDCLAQAQGSQAAIDQCNADWSASTAAVGAWRDGQFADISNTVAAKVRDAEAHFRECSLECCEED